MRNWVWIIALVFIAVSCTNEDKSTIVELRQQEIDKRVIQFIRNRKQTCYETSMERAIVRADSLLKLQAVKYVEDSLQRPPLPDKPKKKIKPAPKDSIQNKPFLQKDTIQ